MIYMVIVLLQLVLKGIERDESTKSIKKPHNDFLMAQVYVWFLSLILKSFS